VSIIKPAGADVYVPPKVPVWVIVCVVARDVQYGVFAYKIVADGIIIANVFVYEQPVARFVSTTFKLPPVAFPAKSIVVTLLLVELKVAPIPSYDHA